jgi:CubicO group peptidase (beta-lactamase class C family)
MFAARVVAVLLVPILILFAVTNTIPVSLFRTSKLTIKISPCPFLGQVYPAPQNLLSEPIWQSMTASLTQAISNTTAQHSNVTSFAIQIIAKESTVPLFEYYHKAPSHLYGSGNTTAVDANTIFRVASMSKMYTVYALLVETGGFSWLDEPITKYVPELRVSPGSAVARAQWQDITLEALASQMSGIGRACTFCSFPCSVVHKCFSTNDCLTEKQMQLVIFQLYPEN